MNSPLRLIAKIRLQALSLTLGAAFMTACEPTAPRVGTRLTVVAYNVENLFDTEHDPGRDDLEFLPLGAPRKRRHCERQKRGAARRRCLALDWTSNRLRLKVAQIGRVVRAAGGGKLPDLLAVTEIENEKVALALQAALGYATVRLTRSDDRRGIDQALFVRTDASTHISVLSASQRPVGDERSALRPILVVRLAVGRERLAVLVNHWPSQAAPFALRRLAASTLRETVSAVRSHDDRIHVLATGDFNLTLAEEDPIADLLAAPGTASLHDPYLGGRHAPPGTYFYRRDKTWSRFDRFYVTSSLLDRRDLDLDPATYRIVAPSWLSEPFFVGRSLGTVRIPKRYNFVATTPWQAGFSDHFPVAAELVLTSEQ